VSQKIESPKKFSKNKTPENKLLLQKYRNHLKSLLRREERKYYVNQFNSRISNSKATWKLINEILHRHNNASTCIQSNKNTISANDFNSYFSTIPKILANALPSPPIPFTQYLKNPNPFSFQLTPTTQVEVLNLINDLSNSTSQGEDQISVSIIKSVAIELSLPLSLVINHSFSKAQFPSKLKTAKIIPLFKEGSKSDPSNYRPISLLNGFSKIFEKALYSRILTFITKYNLLYDMQFGFRPNYSTEYALIKLLDNITQALDAKQKVCSIIIDFKKAFDTVDHNILLSKLYHYGFRGHSLAYLQSYLLDRTQFVSLSDSISDQVPITHGVPQGSILGPILFLIYINDLYVSLYDSSPILFADDTTLSYIGPSLPQLIPIINGDLARLNNWIIADKLTLNLSKTHYIVFQNSSLNNSLPTININDQPIKRVFSTPILGLHVDSNLTFKEHINHVKKKLTSVLFIFSKIRFKIPLNTALTLYNSLFKPHLTYCITIWGSSCPTYIHPLEVLHNKFLKQVFMLPARTPTSQLYSHVSILDFHNLFKYYTAILIYKLLTQPSIIPPPLLLLFTMTNQIHAHSTRSITSNNLFNPQSTHNFRFRSVALQGPIVWNALPSEIKTIQHFVSFKKVTHDFLLKLSA